MGNAFNKEIVRSIQQSAGRFVAIAIISLLGAGFYAGLRLGAPDMRLGGDEFFDGGNLYDLSVMTTFGLDDGSLDILKGVEGVGGIMPVYRAEAMVQAGESSYAACIESFPVDSARESDTSDGLNAVSNDENYLNRPLLVEGSWPASGDSGECVVGVDGAKSLGISLGDTISIEKVSGGKKISETFARDHFTVVGFVNSATYASRNTLGTTELGTGSIDLYAYVDASAFDDELPYSIAYLTVPSARDLVWESPSYDAEVAAVKQRLEDVSNQLADARLDSVKKDLHFQVTGLFQDLSTSLDWADELEPPDVFILDRSKNPGAASLESDADGISKIAAFLPFMFFLVAALVSLTSMTRMVDEERMVIGTHKALGYTSARITSKYLIYGALASGLGSIVGIVLLGKLLPWFIMSSYQVSYAVPAIPLPIDPAVALRAAGLSVGITALATWWAAASTLRSRPAALMLPRAPKAGKRILLEHIAPIWKRMSFSQKVTARNLLRYKRRFFMAVIGVAGCTALLMIGFGLRDMIGGIVSNQYEQLISYDAVVRLDKKISGDDRAAVESALAPDGVTGTLASDGGSSVPDGGTGVEAVLFVDDFNLIARGSEDDMRIEIAVPSYISRLSDFVTLRDRETGQALDLGDDGIILTEKAARVLGVKTGDTVELFDENDVGDATGDGRRFTVAGIAENYLGHYAYMTPAGYKAAFDEKPRFDLAYVKLAADTDAAAFGKRLLALNGVNTVSFVEDKITTYAEMLEIMNKLIYVIMLLSAALAFVVLYNLTNINIAERIREIATLKVLGFTRGEVNAYIFREVMVMSMIGALIGCVIGVPAALYIAEAAETAQMMFGRTIEPLSFVLSFALTMVFAIFIAFTMRGKLVRVNMVESLKSNE